MKRGFFLICIMAWMGMVTNPVLAQDGYSINWYTDAEGLPQNSVKSIFKDKYGFIWLSTNDGLARYDGTSFKIFNNESIPNITTNRMRTFFGNAFKDSVYTTNADGDLILINQRMAKSLSPGPIKLFAGFKATGKPYSPFSYTAKQGLNSLVENPITDVTNTLFIKKPQRSSISYDCLFKFEQPELLNTVYSHKNLMAGQYFYLDNVLYNLTSKGEFYRFNKGVQTKLSVQTDFLKNVTVYDNKAAKQVFFYDNEDLWLVEGSDGNKIVKKRIATGINLCPAKISSFFFDENTGFIYVGSLNKGLGVIKKSLFSTLPNPLEGIDNIIHGMSKINDSTLITGTGLVIQNAHIIQQNNFKEVSDNRSLVYLGKTLWTIKANGLYQLKNMGNYHFVPIDRYEIRNALEYSLLHQKGRDSLWVATSNLAHTEGALYTKSVKNENSDFHKITKTNFQITALIEINKDSVYLGNKNGGLYLLKDYQHNPKIELIDPDFRVQGFHKDGSRFWVTSYNRGFAYIDEKRLIYIPLDKNHYLKNVHWILDDHQGHFWLTTNRGLFKVLKTNLDRFIGGQTNDVYYNYYDKSYGFLTNEFNGGCYSCGLTMKNNRIYLSSLDGVVVFSPTDLQEKTEAGGIYIEDIKTDKNTYTVADSITLQQDFERLTMTVAYPFYNPPNNVNVQARLQGAHSTHSWTPIGADRKISYTNLSPGHYTFKVRKRSNPSQDFQTAQMQLYIPPAYWQTLWFKLSVSLSAALIITGAIAFWIKNLEQKKYSLEKKVALRTRSLKNIIRRLRTTENNLTRELSFQKSIMSSISHDLITPTKYLAIFSEHLYKSPENYKSYNNGEMALIHQTSHEIKSFIENLLIYTRANIDELDKTKKTISLRDFVEDCRRFFEIPLQQRNITFENKIGPQVTMDVSVYILKIIIHNILDNAIKNTTNGKISISCRTEQTTVCLRIGDTGIGMEKDRLVLYRAFFNRQEYLKEEELDTAGLGFKIIKQLLPYVNGEVDIDSHVSTGTTFKIVCELERQISIS